jgi:hypothetical protein
MILKISFVFFIIVWGLPLQGKEPTNAIEWFLETENDKIERKLDTSKPKNYKIPKYGEELVRKHYLMI